MFCPDCGSSLVTGASFCPACGCRVAVRSAPVRYAEFPLRVLATVIDMALLLIPVRIFLFPSFGVMTSEADFDLAQKASRGEVHPSMEQIIQIQKHLMMTVGSFLLLAFLAGWLYYTLMESSPAQGTVGKIICKLKVTSLDGRRIGFARANLRYLGRMISTLPTCLGYLLPLFTEKKQALHDMIAGTLVLSK